MGDVVPFPERGGGYVDLPDDLHDREGVITVDVNSEEQWLVAVLWNIWPTPKDGVLFGPFGEKMDALAEAERINGALPERLRIERMYLRRPPPIGILGEDKFDPVRRHLGLKPIGRNPDEPPEAA